MPKTADNVTEFVERAQEAFKPVADFNQFAATTFERLVRKQWEVAGGLVDLGLEQVKTAAAPSTDVQGFFATQQEIAGRVGETVTKGSLELLEIIRETQGEAIDLFSRQAKDVAEQTKDVVEKAKKAA